MPHPAGPARRLRAVGSPPDARLATDRGEELPVEVREQDADLLLVLLVEPAETIGDQPEHAVFESTTPRGIIRTHGVVRRVQPDLVSFHPESEPEILQRREFFRVPAAQRVNVDDGVGERRDTRSLDLSGGGMLLAGPETLDVGTQIEFWLDLDDAEPPVSGIGRVLRATKDGRRAIVFERIDQSDRERLVRFVFDRQRAARAKTRGDAI